MLKIFEIVGKWMALAVCVLALCAGCEGGENKAESVFAGEMAAARQSGGAVAPASAPAGADVGAPVKDTVTLLELGAKACVPCKMLAPVLAEIKSEYADRAAVVVVDVWEKPEVAEHYGIQAIPALIFYDRAGREVARRMGFMSKEAIREVLDRLLAS